MIYMVPTQAQNQSLHGIILHIYLAGNLMASQTCLREHAHWCFVLTRAGKCRASDSHSLIKKLFGADLETEPVCGLQLSVCIQLASPWRRFPVCADKTTSSVSTNRNLTQTKVGESHYFQSKAHGKSLMDTGWIGNTTL